MSGRKHGKWNQGPAVTEEQKAAVKRKGRVSIPSRAELEAHNAPLREAAWVRANPPKVRRKKKK